MSKPIPKTKATSPQSGSQKWLAIGLGLCLVAIIVSVIAFKMLLATASRGLVGITKGATEIAQAVGSTFFEGMLEVLRNGEPEQRVQVLSQLAETDFSTSASLPKELIDAVKSNLDHRVPEVVQTAELALEAIENSPSAISGGQ